MVVAIFTEMLKGLLIRPPTNLFPSKYKPDNVSKLLKAVAEGKAKINPPIAPPDDYRGKLTYERDKCIGCQQCVRNCPSRAITFLPEEKKIRINLPRCIFCGTCVEVCPVNCLHMTPEFLLATDDRKAKEVTVD